MRFWIVGLYCFFSIFGVLGKNNVGSLVSKSQFEQMFKYSNSPNCPVKGFYTYETFIAVANSFGAFATTGDTNTRKREVAAFLAQTSHETSGGWEGKSDPYAWGYCYTTENFDYCVRNQHTPCLKDYCVPNQQWPCAPDKKYYGRGPIQIRYNYNYGPAGKAIGVDLLNNPDLVANDPTISFKTALWFWMTPQSSKPSCHDAITGRWKPSGTHLAAGRVPGYGLVTNIINGGNECGKGQNPLVENRIGFYKRYCDILGVSYGNNLDCYNQRPFA